MMLNTCLPEICLVVSSVKGNPILGLCQVLGRKCLGCGSRCCRYSKYLRIGCTRKSEGSNCFVVRLLRIEPLRFLSSVKVIKSLPGCVVSKSVSSSRAISPLRFPVLANIPMTALSLSI